MVKRKILFAFITTKDAEGKEKRQNVKNRKTFLQPPENKRELKFQQHLRLILIKETLSSFHRNHNLFFSPNLSSSLLPRRRHHRHHHRFSHQHKSPTFTRGELHFVD